MADAASYIFSFGEGVLTFISPCILPMLPLYFFYLVGSSGKDTDAEADKRRLTFNAIGFIIGFTLIFMILGAAATSLGHFLRGNLLLLRRASGILMILFGLNFAGIINLRCLNVQKHLEYKAGKLGLLSSIIFGIVFGFGWSPCTGAFLGSALLLAANSSTMAQGLSLLLAYSAGLGVPFLVTAIMFDKVRPLLSVLKKHYRLIEIISGIVLIMAGIMVFFDVFRYLSTGIW